jgi:hypothetical protein
LGLLLDKGIELMTWQVWRQDDNGNRFLVGSFPARELADQRIAELTHGHHKQSYWISTSDDAGGCEQQN